MHRTSIKIKKTVLFGLGAILVLYFLGNGYSIYTFSKRYTETPHDVALVLGAGSSGGIVSPVFKERINHGIYLYKTKRVKKILFTGGFGKNEDISDSEAAKLYAIKKGVPANDILTESSSSYTIENILESKKQMQLHKLHNALLVSDPLHMKRSMLLADRQGVACSPSPTQTSMFRSRKTKANLLIRETLFYSFRKLLFWS